MVALSQKFFFTSQSILRIAYTNQKHRFITILKLCLFSFVKLSLSIGQLGAKQCHIIGTALILLCFFEIVTIWLGGSII